MKTRDAYFDNLKMGLMLLVVLGHGIEVVGGADSALQTLYKLIYLFHMPAFVLVCGYFSKKQSPVRLGNLFLQYVILQTVYVLVAGLRGGTPASEIQLGYTTPYWIMWFVFALIVWKLVAPFIARMPKPVSLAAVVALALASGLVGDIGYPFSASRILVFLPFFMLGYHMENKHIAAIKKVHPLAGVAVFGASFYLLARFLTNIPNPLLYGASGYAAMDMGAAEGLAARAGIMAWGLLLTAAFMSIVPEKKIPVLTSAGANTMQVYYLHAALLTLPLTVVAAIGNSFVQKSCYFLLLIAIAFLLSSKPVAWVMKPVLNPIYYLKKLNFKSQDKVNDQHFN